MSIAGSLKTFSLPELFQIIVSGHKSGRLIFEPNFAKTKIVGTFELWFKDGNFVTITDSTQYGFLITEIQNHTDLNSRLLVQSKYSCPKKMPLGDYLQKKNLLISSQINLLFEAQLNKVYKLFKVNSAKFEFEDINSIHIVALNGEKFPYKEMTGQQKKATELSLEAMRNLTDWSHFTEEMPPSDMALQQLVNSCDLQLNSLEKQLWDLADSSICIKKIAQKIGSSTEEVKQAALSMIFAGLIEEVPVASSVRKKVKALEVTRQRALIRENKMSVEVGNKTKASKSLINNLVGFLRNNF